MSLCVSSALAWAPLPVAQDQNLFMPGSQPGSVTLPDTASCTNCHAGFNKVSEPHHQWRGSMMAQATRDPLWLASMAVAAQDSIWAVGNTNAADLCLRCHTPTGWLGGRSDPTNGAALSVVAGDFEGVSCVSCHHMLDPFPAKELYPEIPAETDPAKIAAAADTRSVDVAVLSSLRLFNNNLFFNPTTQLPVHHGMASTTDLQKYIEAGSGQMFVDPDTRKRRGPRIDVDTKSHKFLYSRVHKSRSSCRTCHDVSNPVLANVLIGPGTAEKSSAASFFHLERTSSEFELSDYANPGGAPTGPPIAATGVATASDCQDCHMPRVPGGFAKQGIQTRPDVASHSLTGGNSWMTRILASVDTTGPIPDAYNRAILSGAKYPGATVEVAGLQGAGSALLDGSDRAVALLQRAATLDLMADPPGDAVLRIVNHTGHKLISGFPEGRRMWLNVRFLDANGQTIGEINPYLPLLTTTDSQGNKQYLSGGDLFVTHDDLVYEAKMSSSLTGESHSFHMALATDRYKDNRIPPRGFRIADAAARLAHPRWHGVDAPDYFTAAEYTGGHDEVRFQKPAAAKGWVATLFYQTTSRPYVEFLRDEIKGSATSLAAPTPSGEPFAYVAQTDPFFLPLKGWGDAIWDLWLHNGGSAPVPMVSAISAPLITSFTVTRGVPATTVQTLPGRFYQLERSDHLAPGVWNKIGPVVPGDGSVVTFTDPSGSASGRAFYRALCWVE